MARFWSCILGNSCKTSGRFGVVQLDHRGAVFLQIWRNNTLSLLYLILPIFLGNVNNNRYCFVIICLICYSWMSFGMIYWAISTNQVQEALRSNTTIPDNDRCIFNFEEDIPFTSSFLFSLESQTTIGIISITLWCTPIAQINHYYFHFINLHNITFSSYLHPSFSSQCGISCSEILWIHIQAIVY